MLNEMTVTKVWCEKCHRIIAVGVDKGIAGIKDSTLIDKKDKMGREELVCSVCEGKLSWQMRNVPERSRTSIHVFDEIEIRRP
jgi:lysyl-tRNA synthetase class I